MEVDRSDHNIMFGGKEFKDLFFVIFEAKNLKSPATHCEGDCALNQSSGLKFWSLKVNLRSQGNGF